MSATRGWMLAAAAAMGLGALGLAPVVARYWSERLGAGERQTSARPLRPVPVSRDVTALAEPPAPVRVRPRADESRPEPIPVPGASSAPEPAPEPEDEATAPADAATPSAAAPTAEGAPSALLHPIPPHRPRQGIPEYHPNDGSEALEPAQTPEAIPTRKVSITVLEARTQPGLCKGSNDARHARDALIARFHAVTWDGASMIYLDPRLGPEAQVDLVAELEQAEGELARVLELAPPRPVVFAYYDTNLLLAGGCTNDDVVAYYDGALHVVPTHEDVAQSVLHEYTHHALTSAGLLGPAWAQEGIAMHMAGETWWRRGWMTRVLERPFSLEAMESAVPYTLRSDQAGLFYAQSAAMVACAIRGEPRGLRGLVESLAAGNDHYELSYELPPALAPLAWRSCFTDLAR